MSERDRYIRAEGLCAPSLNYTFSQPCSALATSETELIAVSACSIFDFMLNSLSPILFEAVWSQNILLLMRNSVMGGARHGHQSQVQNFSIASDSYEAQLCELSNCLLIFFLICPYALLTGRKLYTGFSTFEFERIELRVRTVTFVQCLVLKSFFSIKKKVLWRQYFFYQVSAVFEWKLTILMENLVVVWKLAHDGYSKHVF